MAVELSCEELNDVALQEAVVGVQRAIDSLGAQQALLLAEWNARKLWKSDGSKSAAARYARDTGLSLLDARHLMHRAKRLVSMPLCSAAFGSGELSTSRVDLLVRANRPEVEELFGRDEELLLSTISTLSFNNAQRTVHYWSQMADEVGCDNRADRLVRQRQANAARTFEGSVDLRALFDPVSGEIFLTEMERLENELFEADWAEAKALHGDDVRIEDLKRSATQRRCDALVLMAKRSASAGLATPGALLSIVVDQKTFGRTCEMASGTAIAPGQLVPLLSEAQIERIVFDGPSRIVDVGSKRLFKRSTTASY